MATLFGLAGAVHAQVDAEILVSSDITVSTTWTKNNTYNLQDQIYVTNGATLTIEAGTVVASDTGIGGSLAVTRGSQIFIQGTEYEPVIMTSKADVATWAVDASHPTGKDPKSGSWREGVNEWGNLTVMGNAYIGSCNAGNSPSPSPSNVAPMEGLTANPAFPGRTLYGGGDDNDDSGTISYLSIRYGGKVIALANELNGLSLGGIGRETDIHHVEIMNNVDDGIEIWGGCVDIKCFSIWNVGDDSFDIDQGWRGRAQFGLIVQGYSAQANQGSGVGDNCFETDGAEFSDHQPVTTAVIKNCTVIGQQFDGDHATAWRDNARVQYHNMIFMDIGDEVVRFDNIDGDACGTGYGFNGTLSWANTWTTDWNAVPAHPNDPAPAVKAAMYKAQTSGKLAEIVDSVFFNVADIATAASVGVLPGNATNNNVLAFVSPITAITRAAAVAVGPQNKVMERVTFLDPRPANDALTSVTFCPSTAEYTEPSFFSSAKYRGAFYPNGNLWINNWTASCAFGLTPSEDWIDKKGASQGTNGDPHITGSGQLVPNGSFSITCSNIPAPAAVGFAISVSQGSALPRVPFNIAGGTFFNLPPSLPGFTVPSDPFTLPLVWPTSVPAGFDIDIQYVVLDTGAPFNVAFTNGITQTSK